jgi:hypothetical protein
VSFIERSSHPRAQLKQRHQGPVPFSWLRGRNQGLVACPSMSKDDLIDAEMACAPVWWSWWIRPQSRIRIRVSEAIPVTHAGAAKDEPHAEAAVC